MRSFGRKNITTAEIQDSFNEANTDGNGSIDFPEFLAMARREIDSEGETDSEGKMKARFRVFEYDGSGYITHTGLKHGMESQGK
jgi:calmodulin